MISYDLCVNSGLQERRGATSTIISHHFVKNTIIISVPPASRREVTSMVKPFKIQKGVGGQEEVIFITRGIIFFIMRYYCIPGYVYDMILL